MSRRLLLLLPLGAGLLACEAGQAASGSGGGTLEASAPSGGGLTAAGSARALSLPDLAYPEDLAVELERMVELRDASGALQQMHELLLSDGAGSTELRILDMAADPQAPAQFPTAAVADRYLAQQRYYLRYRDFHLGAPAAVHRNYDLVQAPGTVSVAGFDCEHYTLTSVHGLGDAEFFVEPQTRMVLAWTLFDPADAVLARSTALAVDFAPDLNGANWSVPLVTEQPYTGPADDHLLTIGPLSPDYLPVGYYEAEARILLTEALLPGFGNLLVQRYTDGVRQLFIAQHYRTMSGGLQPIATITQMRLSDLGGVRVAEGDPIQRRVYVVGDLALSELHTVFGGLLPTD